MTPAKRRNLLLAAAATLLTVAIGYQFFRPEKAAPNPDRPTPVSPRSDASTKAPQVDSTVSTRISVLTARSELPRKTASTRPRPLADQPVEPAPEEPKPEPVKPPACDQLVFRDGEVIDVRVTEVGISEVRYKRCGREDGPDYVVLKRDVLRIKYPDGSVDRFTP